jgi:lysine-N-methylase
MPRIALPILNLAVREQRYSCHGCGNCCRDFTVQLRDADIEKLREQDWDAKLGEPVTIEFRGTTFLRQREDGACIFLMDDGRCRIHHEFGFEAKPIACQLFPFHLMPASGGQSVAMGINFACQSVLENKGAELPSHAGELRRMMDSLPEVSQPSQSPMLNGSLRASSSEAQALVSAIDQWLRRSDLNLNVRLDGLGWAAASLGKARLESVRERRFADLLSVLFSALPEELAHYPLDPATPKQRAMLRRAAFTRTEDPKLNRIKAEGRLRLTLRQLSRQRQFASWRGMVPAIGAGWPAQIRVPQVETVQPAQDPNEIAAIDDLMTRYLRASVLGGRCWGAGYYGWPMIDGLKAMLLNVAVIGWLARLHAAGSGREMLDITDVRAALGRVDRTSGRAPWLGSAGEKLRLKYLNLDDGLRRLVWEFRIAPG